MRFNPVRIAPVVTFLYRLWVRSIRFRNVEGFERLLESLDAGRPVMLAIWHEELFALTGYGLSVLPGRYATVVSDSRDGELIAQVLLRIGFLTARGSSTRGGLKALKQLRQHMEAGRVGVITVDGPRGPRQKVKDGAVYLAQRSGAQLFPVRSRLSSKHVFQRSWDHFQLPMPFCTCEVHLGQPMEFAPGKMTAEELAQGSRLLEQALRDTLPHGD
ncbi:MAG: lysophospholipid acyltransferase family protein [Proteobacteria bacterium]|nr:lysophospholipid acyltransferase family protein [Pseudomonadota bacterium]MBU1594578.1 lysophospholipid acyltransferase family protein [Pseudomonadota bacterium]